MHVPKCHIQLRKALYKGTVLTCADCRIDEMGDGNLTHMAGCGIGLPHDEAAYAIRASGVKAIQPHHDCKFVLNLCRKEAARQGRFLESITLDEVDARALKEAAKLATIHSLELLDPIAPGSPLWRPSQTSKSVLVAGLPPGMVVNQHVLCPGQPRAFDLGAPGLSSMPRIREHMEIILGAMGPDSEVIYMAPDEQVRGARTLRQLLEGLWDIGERFSAKTRCIPIEAHILIQATSPE